MKNKTVAVKPAVWAKIIIALLFVLLVPQFTNDYSMQVLNVSLIMAILSFGLSILLGASLSFVGMGVQPPTPEWGLMVSDGRSYLKAETWHMSVIPGLAIILVTTALNYLGDGLRDALDPRLNK